MTVHAQRPGVLAALPLLPVQFRLKEGRLVLRVEHVLTLEAGEALEFLLAALADQLPQFAVMVAEKREGRAGGPLLPHEDQRRHGQREQQRTGPPEVSGRDVTQVVNPVSHRAVPHLIVVLDEINETGRFQRVGGLAAGPVLQRPPLALEHPAPVDGVRQCCRTPLVRLVVPVLVARQRDAHLVVKIVDPDAVQLVVSDQFGQVAVILGQQQVRALQRVNLVGQFAQDMRGAVVLHGLRGVQPQPVQAVIPQPHAGVPGDVTAHVRLGVIQALAPRAGKPTREVTRAVARQVIPVRAEVVVHHVQKHAQSQPVRGVHERHQVLGPPVRGIGGVKGGAVVPPAALTCKGSDRHQLNGGYAQFLQVRQPLLRGPVRPLGRKGADVHFVEDAVLQLQPAPRRVLPLVGVHVHHFRLAVNPLRQETRIRVRPRHTVQHEEILRPNRNIENHLVKSAVLRLHRVQFPVNPHRHGFRLGRPGAEAYAGTVRQGVGTQAGGEHVRFSRVSSGRCSFVSH